MLTKTETMKKTLGEMKTLHAGCSEEEPNFFYPTTDPLPWGAGRSKFNQIETITTFTYRPSLVKIDARISSYRGNRPTNTQRPPPIANKLTGPITIHCAAKLSVQCNKS